jgi:hypothetical protein
MAYNSMEKSMKLGPRIRKKSEMIENGILNRLEPLYIAHTMAIIPIKEKMKPGRPKNSSGLSII